MKDAEVIRAGCSGVLADSYGFGSVSRGEGREGVVQVVLGVQATHC